MKKWVLFFTLALSATGAVAARTATIPPRQAWSFSGIDGKYDKEQLRRGLQIFDEKCRSCHGMKYLDFRSLTQAGGPELTPEAAREIAAGHVFPTVRDDGEPDTRRGRLSDPFLSPYANPEQAKDLNHGVAPPDLTYITLARTYDRDFAQFVGDLFIPYAEQGSDMVYAILTGYDDQDPPLKANRYAPGGKLAMAKPLFAGEFDYPKTAEGHPVAPQTEEQYAKDVTAFLTWVADPDRESRQRTGWYAMGYSTVFLGLLLLTMRYCKKTRHQGVPGDES
jgi:cytochrome c1